MYDLLLKGGFVTDPALGLEATHDLAVNGGRIAALEPDIPASQATRTIDVAGALVTPGLVDLHAHVYSGATSIGADPDVACLKRGVTTVVDCGSSGADNFEGFKRWVAGTSRTRIYGLVNLSSIGLTAIHRAGELANPAYADPDGAMDVLRRYPELALGLKIRLTAAQVGGSCLPFLKMARHAASAAGVPIMVHIGDTLESLPQILEWLEPGDIVSHCMTARRNGLLDQEGRILPQVLEARSRGVFFDSAHGRNHFSFEVAARILDQDFLPDSISTDLTSYATTGPVYDLPTTMTKFDALGLPFSKLIELTTARPAAILGKADQFGSLRVGMAADIAVLRWAEGDVELVDATRQTRTARRRLLPILTVRAGEVVPAEDGETL